MHRRRQEPDGLPKTAATVVDGGAAADSLAVYLREAGSVPLLLPEREFDLARRLALARRALRALARGAGRTLGRDVASTLGSRPRRGEPWTLEQVDRFVEDLVRRCRARRDTGAAKLLAETRRHKRRLDDARDQLIRANLRLVVHIAKKYPHPNLALSDLVQEGNLGLIKAVDKYDHRRGNRFSTYAYWWIKQAIERAIGNQARAVRVPVHVQDKARRIRRASETLRARRRREPTTEEIAGELGLTTSKVHEILGSMRDNDPLEDPERTFDLVRTASDPQAVCPFEQVLSAQRRRVVEAALERLTPQEQRLIRLRFGLDGERRPTLQSVGEAMGLSRERVRQIEHRALIKIRSNPTSAELGDLVDSDLPAAVDTRGPT
ncbi:MAG TPA: sigma-70 family RNA polymerase sigma factor [Candidatus Polarisedimenticolaceae bacterium]|nr:sigma-70 family RNA polymerase sigma factor [Candidatus Polarisedimenticolaceae bacterium]